MCIDSDRLRMYIHGTRASISNMSGVGIIGPVKGAKWRGSQIELHATIAQDECINVSGSQQWVSTVSYSSVHRLVHVILRVVT
jgi:hypothetical protein